MSGTIILDKPDQIAMFGLLQLRSRLHLEIKTGMHFRVSTLAAMKARGLTATRSKWVALCDLNRYIKEHGGPHDTLGVDLQKWLAQQGKPHEIKYSL